MWFGVIWRWLKVNFSNLEIINGEYFVAACDKEEIPQYIEQTTPLEQVTVLYWHERDCLILNKSNPLYERYKELLLLYLEMTDYQRKQLNEYAKTMNITFFDFLNKALRIRRRYYKASLKKTA